MRLSVVLVTAVLACSCARLNPAYGDEAAEGSTTEAGSTTDAQSGTISSSASNSASSSGLSGNTTATVPQNLDCEEPPFQIEFSVEGRTCADLLESAGLEPACVALTEWGSNRLRGAFADGCSQGTCTPRPLEDFELGVADLDLPSLFGDVASDEMRCAWVRLQATTDDAEGCVYDRLAVWETSGALRLALGNGPPDDAPELRLPLANPIPITSDLVAQTACGELAPCDRSGYRSILVGSGDDAALPDGMPVATRLSPDVAASGDYVTFNWGLQIDVGCRAWGRWAVIPKADSPLFD